VVRHPSTGAVLDLCRARAGFGHGARTARHERHGDLVDIAVVADAGSKPGRRVMRNLTAVAFNIAQGSIATYYPEANVLVALDHYDIKSGTPSYKSTPVLIRTSRN
jgi:anaerobic selenocysteine-containing dehydrogenase